MLLAKLAVQNFGLFKERYEFNLTTKDRAGQIKPIVLFGGKNGSGKTTLFEAFRLCLYGNSLPEFRLKKLDYNDFVRSKIHRASTPELQSPTSIVSLEFDYARAGKIDKYAIERRWHVTQEGIDEQFEISVNGRPLEELDKSLWQDFVNEMIPIGVSKLFFFDGEQIQVLAQDETDEIHLKDSFYSLLGLDLVDRLRSDLSIRLTKSIRDANSLFGEKFQEAVSEKEKLEQEKERFLQDNAHLKSVLDIRKKAAAKLEDKLSREGGQFARRRDDLNKRKSMLEAEIEQVNKQILKLCENLLPFTFAPQYCASLRKRLIEEDQRQASLMAAKQVKKTLLAVEKKTITSLKRLDLTRKERRKLILRIDQIFQDAMPVAVRRKNGSIKLIHHLSDVEQRKLLGWIDEALNKVPVKIRELTMESERLTLELQKSSDLLNKAPDDEVIAPIFKELSALNRDIGNIEATINANREKVSQTDFKLNLVNSRLRKLEKERRKHASLVRGLALANRLQDALEEYERRLKKEKLEQLSESLLDCLNGLMHKEIFQKVSIDPESFSVTLFDKGNNPVPKDQLSAGEKQIYAIATLWALARTSGRPLPFIVDTPLGRLDSDHRLNLVQNFFPVASHQVIIFSTDTEIDQRYFEELSDYISHSYKLEYEPSKGETKVREGYFWRMNERQEIVANELQ